MRQASDGGAIALGTLLISTFAAIATGIATWFLSAGHATGQRFGMVLMAGYGASMGTVLALGALRYYRTRWQ